MGWYPKELYFHQTILGMVGYLVDKQLIHGRAQKILDCLYAKNDQSMLKNLQRGLVTAFPKGTEEMMEFYIDRLYTLHPTPYTAPPAPTSKP